MTLLLSYVFLSFLWITKEANLRTNFTYLSFREYAVYAFFNSATSLTSWWFVLVMQCNALGPWGDQILYERDPGTMTGRSPIFNVLLVCSSIYLFELLMA